MVQEAQATPDNRNDEDRQLASRARSGDSVAWDLIVARHYRPVHDMSQALARDAELAEDLLQATFLNVKKRLGQYRGDCPLQQWIQVICRNLFRDEFRRRKRRRRAGDFSIDSLPVESPMHAVIGDGGIDPADACVLHMDLEAALASLGEEEQEAFALMRILRYTSEKAARLTGVAPTTMRSRLSRAREQLIKYLDGYREESS